jgi:RimJ/RimL family protein N-acetyltransferase
MSDAATLQTERLRLRPWREEDREPFARLTADPAVMEHFPSLLTRAESDAFADRIAAHIGTHGWGLWAVEAPDLPFCGYVGLARPGFDAAFTPCVEVGWRLAREAWGRGYAPEAARRALRFGFERLGLDEVVSFTVPQNLRSRRVMEKLGMTHEPADDFVHPRFPDDPRMGPHVLYRMARSRWEADASAG